MRGESGADVADLVATTFVKPGDVPGPLHVDGGGRDVWILYLGPVGVLASPEASFLDSGFWAMQLQHFTSLFWHYVPSDRAGWASF